MNETYLYPYSAKEARERNELSLWRESHRANIACREAIEDAIRQNFDGMHLDKDCMNSSGMVASAPPISSGLSGATFRRMSVTMPRSLFGATPPCWMASSVSTARRCRR